MVGYTTMEFRHPQYPFESHYLPLAGYRMHYLDEGTGPPVVFVHGNPTWSFYFRHLVTELRDNFRVIVPDHVGCGLSDNPPESLYEYTLERRVHDFGQLMETLALDQPITLGVHDWGGMIGCAWAVKNPERVARLIIFNTGAFLKPSGKSMPWRLWMIKNLSGFGKLAVQGCNAFAWLATMMATTRPMPPDIRRAYLAPYNSWSTRLATLRFVQDIPLTPHDRSWAIAEHTDHELHKLQSKPTLICWGGRDWVFDHHFLKEFQHRFPHAQTQLFPDAGHYIVEEGGPQLVSLVREFLIPHSELAQ